VWTIIPPEADFVVFRTMNLEQYNRSFEAHVRCVEEEAEARLQSFRQKCLRNFIDRVSRQQEEWEATFKDLLKKSNTECRNVTFAESPSIRLIDKHEPTINVKPLNEKTSENIIESENKDEQTTLDSKSSDVLHKGDTVSTRLSLDKDGDTEVVEPFPKDAQDYFTNNLAIREFIRIQEKQEQNRQTLHELNTNSSFKPFKNELNLFIRTQINSISNSDLHHINDKTRMLTNFFIGQTITFQDKQINVTRHPQGQLLAMDMAAQAFVTVGTRLVNSVPAIAKSMASVINGIVRNNIPVFRDLIFGHLQERCPYLIPMYPERSDFGTETDSQIKYMIACGYSHDLKTQKLESEDKYLARMRSMTLIYACILIQQDNKGPAWSWLASFVSLKPQPVITATILQAFLQETSHTLYTTYGRQFKKLLMFLQSDFVKMIEEVTKLPSEKQPLIKLKNQLADDWKKAR
jgi:hypothetical protein